MPEEKTLQPTIVGSPKLDIAYKGIQGLNVEEIEKQLQKAGANFQPKYVQIKGLDSPEGGEYGVEETLDVVAVILALVKAFIEGGITNYLAALTSLPAAIIGINQVPLEMEDLDEEDVNTLITFVIQNFPTLPTELAQVIVTHAIKALFHIYSIIKVVVENSGDPQQLDTPAVLDNGDGTSRPNPDFKKE